MPLHFPLERPLEPAQVARAKASGAAFSDAIAAARKEAGPGSMVVAWLSDLHLHARRGYKHDLSIYGTHVDASLNLRLALAEILELHADLIVFGGDLADSGCGSEAPADEIDEFKLVLDGALPADAPSLPLLGNHDHGHKLLTPAFHAAFKRAGRADWPEPVESDDYYYAARRGGWRFLALDSRQAGVLSETQRGWLEAQLKADGETPTVVLVHRPFVSVGNWVDGYKLVDRQTFDAIDQAACVKLVLSGHTHKAQAWRYRRKLHCVFPSTAYGIGHACGWGCAVLGTDRVAGVYVKELAGEHLERVAFETAVQPGKFERMAEPLFEDSPLCDPCVLPWRNQRAARD